MFDARKIKLSSLEDALVNDHVSGLFDYFPVD